MASNYFESFLPSVTAWIETVHKSRKTPWVFLYGDLGAGKTTFTKELLAQLSYDEAEVQSPTFLKLLLYKNTLKQLCAHMDVYRIEEEEEFYKLGLEELESLSLGIVEWPEKFISFLKTNPAFAEVLDIKDVMEIKLSPDRDIQKAKSRIYTL